MRFRYFDSEGREVGVASVDALRFRIRKGAVTPETLLYDAAAGIWAPARENSLFRFLVEEEEDLLPPEMRPLMDEDASSGEGGSGSSTPSPVPWREGGGRFETGELDEALEADLPEGEGVAHGVSADSRNTEDSKDSKESEESEDSKDSTDSVDGPLHAVDSEAPGADPEGFPDLELQIPVGDWKRPDADRRGAAGVDSFRGAGAAGGSGAASRRAGSGPDVADSAAKSSGAPGGAKPRTPKRAHRWTSPRRNRPTPRTSSGGRRRRRPSVGGVVALSVIVFALVGVPLLVLGGEGGEEQGSAYALVGGLADDLLGIREGTEAPVGDGPVTDEQGTDAGTVAATSSVSEAMEGGGPAPSTSSSVLDDEVLEDLAAEVAAGAARDLDAAMAELGGSMGVPDSPPEIWLRGRYLAAADSFPEVKRYWQALDSYVASLEEQEEELYRSFARQRVGSLDLDPADAERLTSRVMEGYRATTAADRKAVYGDLSQLALQALVLHEILTVRSPDISYEPFDGRGLSRDPVIEAVAEDEALGERIWSRLDRVLDLLESLQGLGPVTTSQLQEALVRTPGVDPPSPGTEPGGEERTSEEVSAEPSTGGDAAARPRYETRTAPPELPSITDLPVPTQDLPGTDG